MIPTISYISSPEINAQCARSVESIFHSRDSWDSYRVQDQAIRLIYHLFGTPSIPPKSFQAQPGSAYGLISFPKTWYRNKHPVVLKVIEITTAQCRPSKNNPQILECSEYFHELIANLAMTYLLQNQLNPNLLYLYDYGLMYRTKEKDRQGILVLERVLGTMYEMWKWINIPRYRALIARHKLPEDTLVMSFLLASLLSLNQLQNTLNLLHADLKPNNIFLRLTL